MKRMNFIWSMLAIMMAATLSVGLSSCKDDDEDPYLEIQDQSNFEIEIEGESGKQFDIKSNVDWKVSSDKDWIIIKQGEEKGKNNATVHFDVKENPNFDDNRKGTITISSTVKDVSSQYITVTQKSKESEFTVSPTSVSQIEGKGGDLTFNVTSNIKWEVSSNQGWLKVDILQGDGNGIVKATVEPNGTSSTRTAILTFSKKEGKDSSVNITINQEAGGITVTPTSLEMLGVKGDKKSLVVTAAGRWTLSGCPEWLSSSAKDGVGNTTIDLTTLSDNDMSDEPRKATLIFESNGLTTMVSVIQRSLLPSGLRVEASNMTIMSDGFACDLTFGPNTKGYREAFFTEAAVQTMTDRDIFNKLKEMQEYSGSINYTFLPGWVDPGTKLVYCVAAYGNESNSDGSHKYGPMTIERITTRARTIYDDMYLTKSYNSSRWTVNAARQGSYGQRCDEYYYLADEEKADELYFYASRVTYAFLAHLFFKPNIEADRSWGYCNGPQTMNFVRHGDKFFCTTWGIDRDTKNFSAELSDPVYYDLTSSSRELKRANRTTPSDWNKPHKRPSQEEINKIRNSLSIIRVK